MTIGPAIGFAILIMLLFTVGEHLCRFMNIKRWQAAVAVILALLVWILPGMLAQRYPQWLALGLLIPSVLLWRQMPRHRWRPLPSILIIASVIVLAAVILPRGRELLPIAPIYIYVPLSVLVALVAGQGLASTFICAVIGLLMSNIILESLDTFYNVRLGTEIFDAAMIAGVASLLIKYGFIVILQAVRRSRSKRRHAHAPPAA